MLSHHFKREAEEADNLRVTPNPLCISTLQHSLYQFHRTTNLISSHTTVLEIFNIPLHEK